jgi:Predicted RNA-binding protein
MKEAKNEYKASTVDEAIEAGLKELGMTKEEVDVEVKSYGGIFNKASVILTPKKSAGSAPVPEEEAAPEIQVKEEAPSSEELPEVKTELSEAEKAAVSAAEAEAVAFVKTVLEKMGVAGEVTSVINGNEINIAVNGNDAGLVIGYRGEVLDAIQYYALVLANKGEKVFIRVQVDAGNYREKRKETLANLAVRLAHKTAKTGRRTELEPMNPFERRIIHTTLANDRFVTTESEGEGKYRHVVIIPKQRPEGYQPRENRYGSGENGGGGYGGNRYNNSNNRGSNRSGGYGGNRSGGYGGNRSGGYGQNRGNYNRPRYGENSYDKPAAENYEKPAYDEYDKYDKPSYEDKPTYDNPYAKPEGGYNPDFKKKGPAHTRSFGYNNKKF